MSETRDILPLAQGVTAAQPGDDTISMTYGDRLLRRRRLVSDGGTAFLADLPETRGLDEGDAFALQDGTRIAVRAASETLAEITGDLPRLAWHIGNRHTPCEIRPESLRILDDHVLVAMLAQLGATVTEISAPFRPEGGAYGHGRTMGHSHGPEDGHDHGPSHAHPHDHSHAHPHDHSHAHSHDHGQPRHG
ncbi:urease accessory protein UreE [Mangrovicoccus algicola]|uniref:Urease accessory protein UreE n=1 Tax=Mangrovicoccus algicola TaxID=2771008 RepID=A0A8J7CX79_9RHOB|nr:urease accessory protein UreE [Mangrovicoccus algicola]MBE3638637.1 urease accessory protein UreE [Mangrovicoccus algicola]